MSDNYVTTENGTKLPLLNLKGKMYLQVAHRVQWLAESVERYNISTEFLAITEEYTIAKATLVIFNKEGAPLKIIQATKRETKKDFNDHTEKAETAAIGRALSLAGYGTQHALADLDEGERLADSPVTNVKQTAKAAPTVVAINTPNLPVDALPNFPPPASSGTAEVKTTPTATEPAAPAGRPTFRKTTTTTKAETKPNTNGIF